MEIIGLLAETIWNALLLVPKALLAVFPLYNTLSSFNQNLIAASLGVSPVLIWLLCKTIKILKREVL